MLVPARCPLCGHGVSLDGKWFVASIVTQHGVVRVPSNSAYYYHKTAAGTYCLSNGVKKDDREHR